MAAASTLAKRPSGSTFSSILKNFFSGTATSMLAGAVLISVLRRLWGYFREWIARTRKSEDLWKHQVDLGVVQACLLTTEHLATLGRVEKRTLFVKSLSDVFRNEYIVETILEKAEKAAESKEPMLLTHLSSDDKWHILNTCSNHLSSCFAPYHVFFNEARRSESNYRSDWYCFTMTCERTEASGRWFITPHNAVPQEGDYGALRIRVIMMNERELRDIAEGSVEPPMTGLFNGRHESRWNTCLHFADIFSRQLAAQVDEEPLLEDGLMNDHEDQRSRSKRSTTHNSPQQKPAEPPALPEDNCMMRLHIPFPSGPKSMASKSTLSSPPLGPGVMGPGVTKDVILFE